MTLKNFIEKNFDNIVYVIFIRNLWKYNAMNKAVIIGIIIAIAIGIAVSSASFYSGDNTENDSIETETTPESEPKHFSVELSEGLGVSDTP